MSFTFLDLNNLNEIITIDGVFDDFGDATYTNSQFTNNTTNVGSAFVQAGGLLTVTAGGVATEAVKYQEQPCYAPSDNKEWIFYQDYYVETRLKISALTNIAGIAFSHADEDWTIAAWYKVWGGIYYDASGAGNSGVKVICAGTTTTVTTQQISLDTYYNLTIRVRYDLLGTSVFEDRFKFYIDVWLDGVHLVQSLSYLRKQVFGYRIDGFVGVLVDLPTSGAGGGIVTWDYFCSNRLDFIIDLEYSKTSIHSIGQLSAQVLNNNYEIYSKIGKESYISVNVRKLTTDSWERRWHGFIEDIGLVKDFGDSVIEIKGIHYSVLLAKRKFTGEFTDKNTDFIITDGSAGIMLEASEFTTTNVDVGKIGLDKTYFENTLQDILVRLTAEEDFFCFVDEIDDIHFFSFGVKQAINKHYKYENLNLYDHKSEKITPNMFDKVVVYGDSGIIHNHLAAKSDLYTGGDRVARIVNAKIKTTKEAERVGREFFLKNEPIKLHTLEVFLDYSVNVGDTVNVTLPDEPLSVTDTGFTILEIKEFPFIQMQKITIVDSSAGIIDLLYTLYTETKEADLRDIDISSIQTHTTAVDITYGFYCQALVETNTNAAGWVEHYKGKAAILNRGIAIFSGCFGNKTSAGSLNHEADFSGGSVFQIGTGTVEPLITEKALGSVIGGANKTVTTTNLDTTTDPESIYQIATWGLSDANGNTITECGYYVNSTTTGSETGTYKYATDPLFAPFNNVTDLLTRVVFPGYAKTSVDQIRVTFRWFAVMLPSRSRYV